MEQLNGILVLNKMRGLSSAQCTNRLKRLGQKKLGHAGTLDPMAQGVLLVLLGQATKLSSYIMTGGTKTYSAVVELGRTTDTWDDDGETISQLTPDVLAATVIQNPTFISALENEIKSWSGTFNQEVPSYSAAKHEGRPLYKLARAGKETPVKVKQIEILHTEVLWVELPRVSFRVTCSSGTYIRSLAHSLGVRLGCGAVLTELTREYSHPFDLKSAVTLEAIFENEELMREHLLPVTSALPEWRCLYVDANVEMALKNGVAVPANEAKTNEGFIAEWHEGEQVFICNHDKLPLALAEARMMDENPSWVILRGLWDN